MKKSTRSAAAKTALKSNIKINGKARPAAARTKAKATAKTATSPADCDPNDPEMMKAWQAAMTPSSGHRRLEPLVGTFSTRTSMWMAPGAPEASSEGVSEHRWAVGGRYLEQSYRGTFMNMPFEGLGFTGFDNVQGKYVGVWMDSFGTGLMNSTSIGKPSDKQIDFESTCIAPGNKTMKFRCLIKFQGNDRHTYEMYMKLPNGKEHLQMRVEYKRK